ncbi:serine/threonine protein phosphatase PP-X isozyme, putative [Entamoeba invadens IP1]|uniref:Serine/threonine-protein phosphatase n=2 Tax=Entamoeba invadens TaxID=33085 RepID=A0A0A1U2M9_ENTIV|nr:serine/threonine protein phosphatase PP-X isozyme, putative [Entamoeba invadens IP1]ELP88331.1 serine/threonine protein phosphatase PP-X isozyme, putative [Entamoeba invadens IP1]BAN41331.1 serine/threonine protein phosphatase PP-X isozyme, putative [Entamoeba invadens]|eukprot:XP_004255102.1 serine/threonine protein phosphatase PP-X isozyme, putative [Entamoeba invadens IP1]
MPGDLDIDRIINRLWNYEMLEEYLIYQLTNKVVELMSKEPTVLTLNLPCTVVGDIHGQFHDLKELFSIAGTPPETTFVFLGDYVDRGHYGLECLLLLAALKLRFPTKVSLLRGNHECSLQTRDYGFYDECMKKYGNVNVWKKCISIFEFMATAATLDNSIFCVHGGLSETATTLDSIKALERTRQIPPTGGYCELMWSDPDENQLEKFKKSSRGAGCMFNSVAVQEFNQTNNTQLVCRAHQLAQDGYQWFFKNLLVTVWSAPKYCYRMDNVASVMEIDSPTSYSFKVFEAAPQDTNGFVSKRNLPECFM